jgi:hypothetical protein
MMVFSEIAVILTPYPLVSSIAVIKFGEDFWVVKSLGFRVMVITKNLHLKNVDPEKQPP